METKNYAKSNEPTLITGASSGIGEHLAREFARHGHPVVLVAPLRPELEEVAEKIRSDFGVEAQVIDVDLTDEDAVNEIAERLEDLGLDVRILCNNAGVGRRGKFSEIPLDQAIEMSRLNVEAPIRLTKHLLPKLLSRGGRILNTASVAGFEPGPLLAVYHASKAFLLSWSEALATELEDSNVTVTALCPGPVDTDFFPKADMIDTNAFQKAKVMSPQEVAEAAYRALMEGERVIVPGVANKALVFKRRFTTEEAQSKLNEKMYEETAPEDRKRERGEVEAEAEWKRS